MALRFSSSDTMMEGPTLPEKKIFFAGKSARWQVLSLAESEERWDAPDHPKDVLPRNWGGTDQNSTVTYMVLIAKTKRQK
ncbi:hypothetical protein TNCV_3876921 [Trichonephila clavipes]|uniref:Uncharacterized protein n=1 Tax=Trichonephila clavipes TaxID=2585209 RepID=A0A8X6SS51_TRICX|nr:hypothetical protein TNCV_3876921 [Trichonephila clavipes]